MIALVTVSKLLLKRISWVFLFLIGACQPVKTPVPVVELLNSPAGILSEEARLFADSQGEMLLSWLEKEKNDSSVTHFLKVAHWEGNAWSDAQTIAKGSHWFVNWADFPAIARGSVGDLLAHYLEKSGPGTYAYGVRLVHSADKGLTWSKPFIPHDTSQTEHGFVSLAPGPKGKWMVAWLDGRNTGKEQGAMTLRSAVYAPGMELQGEYLLDDRVCDCCQTDAIWTSAGPVVVYRNRTESELRDIGIVRWEEDHWTEPILVHTDGWQIAGCPVNGPAIASNAGSMGVAWYTESQQTPKTLVALSYDNGRSFSNPLRFDDGNPVGRVEIVPISEKEYALCWLEKMETGAEIRLKLLKTNKQPVLDKSHLIARTSSERASGFPQMAMGQDALYFAWTHIGEQKQIYTARLFLKDLK